jgi:hypothetical protein
VVIECRVIPGEIPDRRYETGRGVDVSRRVITRSRTPVADVGLPMWSVGSTPFAGGTLAVVPAAGGEPRQLAAEFASARHPVWSPGGRQLLFIGESGSRGDGALGRTEITHLDDPSRRRAMHRAG